MTNAVAIAQQGSNNTTFRNRIINGAMVIDQRNAGASVTALDTNLYTLDRWQAIAAVSSKYTVQQNAGSVTPPAGFVNYLGVTSSSAYSVGSTEYFFMRQRIEGFNIADLNWGSANAKAVTLSFWVRSSLTGTFGGAVRNNATDRSYPYSYTISSANTWEQKTITIPGDTTGTWLTTNGVGMNVDFGLGVGSTYQGTANTWAAANYLSPTSSVSVIGTSGATFYLTGVQLEAGSAASPFEYRLYDVELAACQRYFWRINGGVGSGSQVYNGIGTGNVVGSTQSQIIIPMTVTMRSSPTISYNGNIYFTDGGGGGPISSLGTNYGGTTACLINWNYASGGLITGRGVISYTGSVSGSDWIAGSAEL